MKIDCIQNNQLNRHRYSFKANIASPRLQFNQADFFVRIKGYGTNRRWAEKTRETADTAVTMVWGNTAGEYILKYITGGIQRANVWVNDMAKVMHTGILRSPRKGWQSGSDWDGYELWTNYSDISRYKPYQKRLDNVVENPLTNPFKEIRLTKPVIDKKGHYLKHAGAKYVNSALKLIIGKYNSFTDKYNAKNIQTSQLTDVNNDIAEVRWIIAHATPWERGSDAISNVLMRVMYKSLGIKSYPLKKGVSLDMEAYCTELDDYKKRFPEFFEKTPEIIE